MHNRIYQVILYDSIKAKSNLNLVASIRGICRKKQLMVLQLQYYRGASYIKPYTYNTFISTYRKIELAAYQKGRQTGCVLSANVCLTLHTASVKTILKVNLIMGKSPVPLQSRKMLSKMLEAEKLLGPQTICWNKKWNLEVMYMICFYILK